METDVREITQTEMNTGVPDYSPASAIIDEEGIQKETWWDNPHWSEYYGYFKEIPELHQAVIALATWTAGKGWTADVRTKILLDNVIGWGEDSFQSIMENMLMVKKVNGDAFAEIMRKKNGDILNIKPIQPSRIRTVVDNKGIILRYEELNPKGETIGKKFTPDKIFHISNDRIANQIHGTSVLESCKWIIDARNEAMRDWRRILHRSSIRVMYVDVDNQSELNIIKSEYKEAIKNGELMLIPAKKGEAELLDVVTPPHTPFLDWIRYTENFFYQAVGVPKIILGGSQEFTEASSKIGYLTFEQVYMREQRELETDLWSQLGIKVEFERPISLKDDVVESEAKNTGQVGFQQTETEAQVGRVE